MGEGGGDDDEEGESEDEDEDGEGTRLLVNGLETIRRKHHIFYFKTGTVIRKTSHHGSGTCRMETLKSCKTSFRSVILN